jgi:hypothetical protein
MSTPTLPNPQAAYDHLTEKVHCNIFFDKLARAGIVPQTEKEASDLLQLAGRLRHVEEQEKVAQAEQGGRFGGALAALDHILGQNKQASVREAHTGIKRAAVYFKQDPEVFNSILALKQHEALQNNRAAA